MYFSDFIATFAPDKHQEGFNAHQPSLRYATVVKGCELTEY